MFLKKGPRKNCGCSRKTKARKPIVARGNILGSVYYTGSGPKYDEPNRQWIDCRLMAVKPHSYLLQFYPSPSHQEPGGTLAARSLRIWFPSSLTV